VQCVSVCLPLVAAASPSDVAATFIELGAPAVPVRQSVWPLVESVTRPKVNGQQAYTHICIYIYIQTYLHRTSFPCPCFVSLYLRLYANPSLFRLMGFINKSFRGFPI